MEGSISPIESSAIEAGLDLLTKGNIVFVRPSRLARLLREHQETRKEIAITPSSAAESRQAYSYQDNERRVRFVPPRPREWDIGFTDGIWKEITQLDPKLSKLVLRAIREICREPITLKGDTVKPLTENFKGLWRYRISKFRLIYRPEPEKERVMLLSFENRGDAYRD